MAGIEMKLLVITVAFVMSGVYGADTKPPANISYVRNLNMAEFNRTMKESDFLVVCFYTKNSRMSTKFAPIYDQLATLFHKEYPKIMFAEIDIMRFHEVENVHYILEIPMLKFYKKGRYFDYKGAKTMKHITTWIHMAMNVPLIMSSRKEFDDLKTRGTIIVGCFLGNQPKAAFDTFMNVSSLLVPAKYLPVPKFALITKASVSRDIGMTTGTVAIIKSFESGDKVTYSGSLTDQKKLLQFCEEEGNPVVFPYGHNEFSKITSSGDIKYQHLLFMSPSDSKFKQIYANFKAAAKEFMKSLDNIEVIFIHVNTDAKHIEKAVSFFHVDLKKDVPCNRMTKYDDFHSKFKPEKMDFTKEGFIDFTRNIIAGKTKRSVRSEVLPGDWNKYPLKILVGSNYEEVTQKKGTIVFVMYYIPDDKDCESAKPVIDEVAMKYRLNNTVTIATMDVSKNDGEVDVYYKFPNFKMFNAKNKRKKFKGTISVDAITTFIDSNGTNHIGAIISDEPTEGYEFEDHAIPDIHELDYEEEEEREYQFSLEEQKMIDSAVVSEEGHQAHSDPDHMVNPDHHEMEKRGEITDHKEMDPKAHAMMGDNETHHHDPDKYHYGHMDEHANHEFHHPPNESDHYEHHDL